MKSKTQTMSLFKGMGCRLRDEGYWERWTPRNFKVLDDVRVDVVPAFSVGAVAAVPLVHGC